MLTGDGRSLCGRWVWVVVVAVTLAVAFVQSGCSHPHRRYRDVVAGSGADRRLEDSSLPQDPSSLRIVDLARASKSRRRSVVLAGAAESGSRSGQRRESSVCCARGRVGRPKQADRGGPWRNINQSSDSKGFSSATSDAGQSGSRILGQNGVNPPARTQRLRSLLEADSSPFLWSSPRVPDFNALREASRTSGLTPGHLGLPIWKVEAVVPSPLVSSLFPSLVPLSSRRRNVPNSSSGAAFVIVCATSKCRNLKDKVNKHRVNSYNTASIDRHNFKNGGGFSDSVSASIKQVDQPAKKDLTGSCVCGRRGHKIAHRSVSQIMAKSASMEMGTTTNSTTLMSGSVARLRGEAWVVPLIILASINLVIISCFEAFVLVKMVSSRPSRRHFFLGQMLLLGLFLSTLISFAYVTPPNLITCTVVRLGVGLSYAFVFATLLVKIIFLISLNNGVYLPAAYHGLLLFFVVGVQVAVGVQWLIQRPPIIIFRQVGGVLLSTCNTSFDDMLISLVYAMFLLAFVTLLAAKSRSIRDNYREAMYIGLSVGCTIPLWVTWMVIALVLRGGYEEPCLAFGLVLNASFTFVIMFVPKGRQLAALGKEGLYADDHHERGEDRVSSVSPPSMYTPSFYHFKPALGPPREHPQGTIFKTPLPPERPSYPLPPPPPPRAPRYPVYPHGYYNYDDAMYYSMVRTMANNPNVHFVRNPMMY